MAITFGISLTIALVQLSPTSSKNHKFSFCLDIKAIALPASRALPPPIAITPSLASVLNLSTPSLTFLPVGLPFMSVKIEN